MIAGERRGCPDNAVIDDWWRRQWEHEMAAISEGLCPVHRSPLSAVPGMPARRIAGHCAQCRRFWGINLDTEVTGWWLDHQPWNHDLPEASLPGFMTEGPAAG